MIKEAIDKIEGMAQNANRARVIEELSDRRIVTLDLGNGELRLVDRRPQPRMHVVTALESFVAVRAEVAEGVPIWVSPKMITSILDPWGLRIDQLSMLLHQHAAFGVLVAAKWCTQRELIDVLRHDLADCEIGPEWTLDAIRTMRFASSTEQVSTVKNTSAALGKSVQSQVTGARDLPDTVQVSFHPYPGLSEEIDCTVAVHCTLFVDTDKSLLRLAPHPGQIEQAGRQALLALKSTLETIAETEDVYLGTP